MISSFNSIEKWLWGIWPITDYNFNILSSHFIFFVWHTVTEQLEIFFHFCRFSLLLFPFYMQLFHFCLYFLCFWGLVQKTIASTRVLRYSFCFLLIFSNFPDFNRSSSSIFVFFLSLKISFHYTVYADYSFSPSTPPSYSSLPFPSGSTPFCPSLENKTPKR